MVRLQTDPGRRERGPSIVRQAKCVESWLVVSKGHGPFRRDTAGEMELKGGRWLLEREANGVKK